VLSRFGRNIYTSSGSDDDDNSDDDNSDDDNSDDDNSDDDFGSVRHSISKVFRL